MKNFMYYIRLCPTGIIFMTAFFFSGCSVFSSVGNTISQGYENMISYFNAYYNARILFSDAEDEIKTASLLARGKEIPAGQATQIPATAKQKLGLVIDKCSNILAYHSSSNLVDNALLLIGKSFYYQMEYLKGERKFAELLAQFPNSSLTLEAQLWYARSEEKLGKLNDGIRLGDATVSAAQTSHDNEIETQAHKLLGIIYRRMNQTDKSIAEYEKIISISSDDDAKGDAQISLGDIYFADGQYKKSTEVYIQTQDFTSDIYSNYYSKLQAAIAYREIGEQKKGLTLVDAMIDDFRNKDYFASIFFEQANNYSASGRRDEAINVYVYVDTTYAHTEYATRSAYQLGLIFEKELGLYWRAMKYYSELTTAADPSIVADGSRKFVALTRYFDARHRLKTADSLLFVLSDTTRKIITDTMYSTTADSVHQKAGQIDSQHTISNIDSLKEKNVVSDTAHRKLAQIAVKAAIPSADSLHVLKSIAAQELGDIFYSEVVEPDSAFYWYNNSLLWSYKRSRSPRILYILAELSRIYPEKKFSAPEEYYSRLDHDFPESIYTEEVHRLQGKASNAVKTDTASEYYAQSEKQIDDKQYEKAIGTLRSIIHSFPKSPFAAKSEYAIGWILENSLEQPDSAMVQYKRVVKNYGETMYALAASKRYTEVQQSDTAKTKNNSQIQKSFSPDSVQRNSKGLEQDTVKQPQGLPRTDIENGQRKKAVSKPKIID
jgi:tetratricopeptide (TPR) repeat protein